MSQIKMRQRWTKMASTLMALLLLAAACQAEDGAEEAEGADTDTEEAGVDAEEEDADDEEDDTADDDLEERNLAFGHLYETTHPFHACGAEPFAEAVADAGVNVTVDVFPAGEMGGEQELVQSAEAGDLDISIAGPGAVANWHAPWGVLDAAYAVEDWDHMRAVYESDIGEELRDGLLDDAGIHTVDLWLYGSRHVTSNAPVHGPEDLEGVDMRAIDTPLSLANAEAMGADPAPVAFDELYLALQQGVVDAQENPIPTIESLALYEVQDYLNLTGHLVQSTVVMMADHTYEGLADEQLEVVISELEAHGEAVAECVEQEEEEKVEEWDAEGTFEGIVHEDEIDIEAFQEAAAEQLPPQFEDEWGEGLHDRVVELGDEG